MLLRPTKVLIATTCIVGAIFVATPFMTAGRGAFAWAGFAAVQGLGNALVFLVPAMAIWLAFRKRSPTLCSVAIVAWGVSYFGLLFLLLVKSCCG